MPSCFNRSTSTKVDEIKQKEADARRRSFGAMFEGTSADGPGGMGDSEVLDTSAKRGSFDLRNCSAVPVTVDTDDYKPPPRPKWEYEATERTSSSKHHELSEEDQARRAKFNHTFSNVDTDDLSKMSNAPAALQDGLESDEKALKYPIIEKRVPTEAQLSKVPSQKYTEKHDRFVEMYSSVESIH